MGASIVQADTTDARHEIKDGRLVVHGLLSWTAPLFLADRSLGLDRTCLVAGPDARQKDHRLDHFPALASACRSRRNAEDDDDGGSLDRNSTLLR